MVTMEQDSLVTMKPQELAMRENILDQIHLLLKIKISTTRDFSACTHNNGVQEIASTKTIKTQPSQNIGHQTLKDKDEEMAMEI